jgi:hypothetical protein
MNTTSKTEGLNQGGPGDQAGPATDPRDTGEAGSQQGRPQTQPTRPGPARTGRKDDASPAPDGPVRGESAAERGIDRQGTLEESRTGGDPRTPDIPGT